MKLTIVLMLATAIIMIDQPPQTVPCPPSPPQIIKNSNGTYSRPAMNMVNAVNCWTNYQSWVEEWTDYPEKGGTFIQRITPEKDAK